GHPLLVLLAVHPVAQLVGVAQLLLLLLAQPRQLALDLLLLLLVPRLLELRLELAHLPVQVLLALGQLLEAAQHLPRLALLGVVRLLFGGGLRLVAVLLLVELELVELLLAAGRGAGGVASLLLLVAADDLVLAGA